MKSILISLPCTLAVALYVARVVLTTLNMPTDTIWLLTAVLFSTAMLFGRGLVELGLIGFLALIAQLNSAGLGVRAINPDVMLALLIVAIVLPSILRRSGYQDTSMQVRKAR